MDPTAPAAGPSTYHTLDTMDQAPAESPQQAKRQRASTSSKNRDRSPSPYRSRPGQTATEFANEFWQHTITTAEESSEDFKHQALPLARIKKVMKSDPDVQMISSEVTILFEKACQIFIHELTLRSHVLSLDSRRRTLARVDVAGAIAKSDMFDFLIDTVPRDASAHDDEPPKKKQRYSRKKGPFGRRIKLPDEDEEDEEVSSPAPKKRGRGKGRTSVDDAPEASTTPVLDDEQDLLHPDDAAPESHLGTNGHGSPAGPSGNGMEISSNGMETSGMGAGETGRRYPLPPPTHPGEEQGGPHPYSSGHDDYGMAWPLEDPYAFRGDEDAY